MLLNKQEKAILNEFAKDRNSRIYGRAIAKNNNLNQKTVSNALNNLEKKDVLKFKREGKNKYYFLNKNNPHLREIIQLVEMGKKIDFINNNLKIKNLFDKLVDNSEGILIVFGSYAKDSNKKNSDLDLFVIGKTKGLKEIEESFKIEINAVKVDKNKFDKNEPFIKEVMENHIVLKGLEEFMDLAW